MAGTISAGIEKLDIASLMWIKWMYIQFNIGETRLNSVITNRNRKHTSAWGSHSFGGASAERRQFSMENKTRFFPGVGNVTCDTIWDIMSHKGLLKSNNTKLDSEVVKTWNKHIQSTWILNLPTPCRRKTKNKYFLEGITKDLETRRMGHKADAFISKGFRRNLVSFNYIFTNRIPKCNTTDINFWAISLYKKWQHSEKGDLYTASNSNFDQKAWTVYYKIYKILFSNWTFKSEWL